MPINCCALLHIVNEMPSFSLWGSAFTRYFPFNRTQGKKTPVKRQINSQHFFDNPLTPGGLPVIQNLTKFGQMTICCMVMTSSVVL